MEEEELSDIVFECLKTTNDIISEELLMVKFDSVEDIASGKFEIVSWKSDPPYGFINGLKNYYRKIGDKQGHLEDFKEYLINCFQRDFDTECQGIKDGAKPYKRMKKAALIVSLLGAGAAFLFPAVWYIGTAFALSTGTYAFQLNKKINKPMNEGLAKIKKNYDECEEKRKKLEAMNPKKLEKVLGDNEEEIKKYLDPKEGEKRDELSDRVLSSVREADRIINLDSVWKRKVRNLCKRLYDVGKYDDEKAQAFINDIHDFCVDPEKNKERLEGCKEYMVYLHDRSFNRVHEGDFDRIKTLKWFRNIAIMAGVVGSVWLAHYIGWWGVALASGGCGAYALHTDNGIRKTTKEVKKEKKAFDECNKVKRKIEETSLEYLGESILSSKDKIMPYLYPKDG